MDSLHELLYAEIDLHLLYAKSKSCLGVLRQGNNANIEQ